ncbi:MAG: hypothetical protein KKF48_02155 [Nanoarchaeota archaeon]|nr:hypothetical protein [Nanoarchaeota archaeon]MBU1027823.1 hypothetical protein [Nanoarchaeota archaeon]
MAKVEIAEPLKNEILNKFGQESKIIFRKMYSLEENPKKGNPLGQVAGIVIKELKYKSYRFYFITDGHKLKIMSLEQLSDLLIKFVRISDKKSQQKTINEIKDVLKKVGREGFG